MPRTPSFSQILYVLVREGAVLPFLDPRLELLLRERAHALHHLTLLVGEPEFHGLITSASLVDCPNQNESALAEADPVVQLRASLADGLPRLEACVWFRFRSRCSSSVT